MCIILWLPTEAVTVGLVGKAQVAESVVIWCGSADAQVGDLMSVFANYYAAHHSSVALRYWVDEYDPNAVLQLLLRTYLTVWFFLRLQLVPPCHFLICRQNISECRQCGTHGNHLVFHGITLTILLQFCECL